MDFSIDPAFINDTYALGAEMSGQWNWTWGYESAYYGIPWLNFSGWLYMTGLYPAFIYLLEWFSGKIKKPGLQKAAPFIAGVGLIFPIVLFSPLMGGSTETGELVRLICNCLAGVVLLVIFHKRKGAVTLKDEPLLFIVPAAIYAYELVVVFVRGMWSCLPPVLVCMAAHALYYLYLNKSGKKAAIQTS